MKVNINRIFKIILNKELEVRVLNQEKITKKIVSMNKI